RLGVDDVLVGPDGHAAFLLAQSVAGFSGWAKFGKLPRMQLLEPDQLPQRFADVDALEELMTRPSRALVEDLAAVEGDILILCLGVGGKMGPTLARVAKRAAPATRVAGVARFSAPGPADSLQRHGVETIACDLLDRAQVARLPKLPNVIYMAGRKFGAVGQE